MKMISRRFYFSPVILCLTAGCSSQNSNINAGNGAPLPTTPTPIRPSSAVPSSFKMTAEIKFKKLPSQHGENRVHITVYLSHQGAEPSWWSDDNPGPSASIQNVRFVDRSGHEYLVKDYKGESGHYIQSKQTRVMLYSCVVPKEYDLAKTGFCKGTVVVYAKVPQSNTFPTIHFSEKLKLP